MQLIRQRAVAPATTRPTSAIATITVVCAFAFAAAIAMLATPSLASDAAIAAAAAAGIDPGALSNLSSGDVAALKKAAKQGELTPEASRALDSMPPEVRAAIEAKARERDAGADKEEDGDETTDLQGGKPIKEPAYDWRKSQYVWRLFGPRLDPTTAAQLVHFGHDLFDRGRASSGVGDAYPVPPDYMVGPGDEVVVKLWGRMEGTHHLVVDRNGRIFFPKLGSMYVAGKTFGEMKAYISSRIKQITEVSADISMGELKGFPISVVGEVAAPGRYNVTSFHTVLQTIMMAGGIRDIGSLRNVQVKSGRKTLQEVDVYDFLLRGDVSRDVRLQGEVAVFVPVAGPLVAVVGEVRRQAIYELKDEKTIAQVLEMAGGVSPSAFTSRVQIERLQGNRAWVLMDLDLSEAKRSDFAMQDGDIVRVLPVLLEANVVRIEGNVQRPGRYEWKPGMKLGSLIPDTTFFLPETYLDYAVITRFVGPAMLKHTVAVDLRKIIVERDATADVDLLPQDVLTVFNESEFVAEDKASVVGEIRKAGDYRILAGMRVSDLVMLGGGLTQAAFLPAAELTRLNDARQTENVTIDLGKAIQGDPDHDLVLKHRDMLVVRPIPELDEVRYIRVRGEVRSPGLYAARKDERISSIVERAGGLTMAAFLPAAVFTRESVRQRQQELLRRAANKLEEQIARAERDASIELDANRAAAKGQTNAARRILLEQIRQAEAKGRVVVRLAGLVDVQGKQSAQASQASETNLLIENGDELYIPRAAEVVHIEGRVYNSTAVRFLAGDDGERGVGSIGDYLRQVGGMTEDADREHVFVVRADGSVMTTDTVGEDRWFFDDDDFLEVTLGPGDAIIVPDKIVTASVLNDVKDITQIMFQIAVTAGVLIAAF